MNNKNLVYIIDDDPGILDALSWLLSENKIESKIFLNLNDFHSNYVLLRPSAIVSDIILPDNNYKDLMDFFILKEISEPIIFITGHAKIDIAVSLLKKGAFDFIEKPINNAHFIKTIQQAITHQNSSMNNINNNMKNLKSVLTKRQFEILKYVVQGHSSKVIANKLNISNKTVEAHRSNIMKKTNSNSLSDLIILTNLYEFE